MRQRSAVITAHTIFMYAVARAFNKARNLQEVFAASIAYSLDTNITFSINPIVRV